MNFLDSLFGQYDIALLKLFNQPYSVSLNILFIVLIYLIYPILTLLALYFLRTKQHAKFFHLVLAVILGYMFVLGLKYYVDRPRPYETHLELAKFFEKTDPSFPSAHAFLSFVSLYFIPKGIAKWMKYTFVFYLVVLIPFGVMYSAVHYPSDLLFGAIIGLLIPKIISENVAKKIFRC